MAKYEIIQTDKLKKVRFYTSVDSGSYIAPHWHDALEIIFMQEGSLHVADTQGAVDLTAGDCILINPNHIHSTLCSEYNRAVVFQIPLASVSEYMEDLRTLRFRLNSVSMTSDAEIRKIRDFTYIIEQMQEVNDSNPRGGALKFNSLLFEALHMLYQDFSYSIPAEEADRHNRNMSGIFPVLQYTSENYTEHISIAQASEILGFEPHYFCRLFKKSMGITYLEYQNELRLSHIVQDLLYSDKKLQVILDEHGFTNYKVFRQLFYDHYGTTPMKFRNAQHKYQLRDDA